MEFVEGSKVLRQHDRGLFTDTSTHQQVRFFLPEVMQLAFLLHISLVVTLH